MTHPSNNSTNRWRVPGIGLLEPGGGDGGGLLRGEAGEAGALMRGRPALRDNTTATGSSHTVVFAPNPPPISAGVTRMSAAFISSTPAVYCRIIK